MSNPSDFQTKLKKILQKYGQDIHWVFMQGVSEDYPLATLEAKQSILNLIRESLPEESKSTCVCDRDACWNDYRDAVLKKLEREG